MLNLKNLKRNREGIHIIVIIGWMSNFPSSILYLNPAAHFFQVMGKRTEAYATERLH